MAEPMAQTISIIRLVGISKNGHQQKFDANMHDLWDLFIEAVVGRLIIK